jgi:SAM-dependent methyltransferase
VTHPAPYTPDFYRRRDDNTRASAEAVVPLVLELTAARSVVDVGCGVGTWLDVFRRAGVDDVFGVEGDWVDRERLVVPDDRFRARDLRSPLDLGRRFDLAVSLEVAEHLPPECAAAFVDSLTALAPVVLFSAAVPFQGGRGHLNERWPSWWAELFAGRGYAAADAVRPALWNRPEVRVWYVQNTLLFVDREHLATRPRLAAAVAATDSRRLDLVHPRLYERNSDPRRLSLRTVLGVLPRLAAAAVRRRLGGRRR